jgi:hypothetical protein
VRQLGGDTGDELILSLTALPLCVHLGIGRPTHGRGRRPEGGGFQGRVCGYEFVEHPSAWRGVAWRGGTRDEQIVMTRTVRGQNQCSRMIMTIGPVQARKETDSNSDQEVNKGNHASSCAKAAAVLGGGGGAAAGMMGGPMGGPPIPGGSNGPMKPGGGPDGVGVDSTLLTLSMASNAPGLMADDDEEEDEAEGSVPLVFLA